MEKIIERNVPIAEENETLTGQPATNMYEDWSEEIVEIVEIPQPHKCGCGKSQSEVDREKRLKEMDEVVKEDLENTKS